MTEKYTPRFTLDENKLPEVQVAQLGVSKRRRIKFPPDATGYKDMRLVVAAANTYVKHCGEKAVECAEEDLLGQSIELAMRQETRRLITGQACQECGVGSGRSAHADGCSLNHLLVKSGRSRKAFENASICSCEATFGFRPAICSKCGGRLGEKQGKQS